MSKLARLILSVIFTGLILFCIFGLRATCEPMDSSTQLKWRIIYGVALTVNVVFLTLINRSPQTRA